MTMKSAMPGITKPGEIEFILRIGTINDLWRKAQHWVKRLTESGPRPVMGFLKQLSKGDPELAAKVYWELKECQRFEPWVYHALGASELLPPTVIEVPRDIMERGRPDDRR